MMFIGNHRRGIRHSIVRNKRRSLIMKIHPCKEDTLTCTPHFYIVKLGFTRVFINLIVLSQNIDCGYLLEPPR